MQLQPSVLLYSQAVIMIKQLDSAYKAGLIKTAEEFSSKLDTIISRFHAGAGSPMFFIDPLVDYEPPLSSKINRAWNTITHDIATLQNQVDLSRAASVMSHNYFTTEIKKASEASARLLNKVKVLQLYSDSVDSNVIVFGDTFGSEDFLDETLVDFDKRVFLNDNNFISLGVENSAVDLTNGISCKILETSNGIAGNNQELLDNSRNNRTPPGDNDTSNVVFTFVAEENNPNKVANIYDQAPNTVFEYERYHVTEEDKRKAKNFNFRYRLGDGRFSYYNWAEAPDRKILKLDLEFDLKTVKVVNLLQFTGYGLRQNRNLPVKVRLVETSENGSDWLPVTPRNVWIGTSVNVRSARKVKDMSFRSYTWAFEARSVRYVRFHLEQPNPIEVRVGHLYYIKREEIDGKVHKERVRGPVPRYTNPTEYLKFNPVNFDNIIQKRERFNGKRWAIGIRDIAIQQLQYKAESVLITKPLRVGGLVDRVALECELDIPESFNTNDSWVDFYISPDDGLSWHPISRVQDDYLDMPEILAFNDPTPAEFRDPNVQYINTTNAVDSLRLKIILKRPSDKPTSSPVIRSYRLKVRRK